MNTIKTIVTLAILGGGLTGRGQSTFQDLDFEAATPGTPVYGPIGPYYQPVNLALPGWTVYMGTTQQTEVTQNAYSLGEGAVDIFGPKYQSAGAQGTFQPGIINGNYTVFLQAGTPTGLGDAIIEQNGTIAAKEQTLIWKQWDWLTPAQNPTASVLTVSFSGNVLTPVVLGSGANYTLYGANIAPYAGQTGELEFDASDTGLSWIELDDISFSNTSVVPEPSTLALTGFGGLIFALHRRFQKQ